MAITATTLSAAAALATTSLKVAAGTNFGKGKMIRIDNEVFLQTADADAATPTRIPVTGGQEGTVCAAHPSGALVRVGDAFADFPVGGDSSASPMPYPPQANMPVYSYSATGAITPSAGIHYLNGTGALPMSVAAPTKAQDGEIMYIASNGAAAHVVTFTGGLSLGGGSYDVITVNATGPVLIGPVMAVNGAWQLAVSVPLAGTVANITASLA